MVVRDPVHLLTVEEMVVLEVEVELQVVLVVAVELVDLEN